MNKILLLFSTLIIFNIGVNAQEILIAGWSFPEQSAAANEGTEGNIGTEIYTMGGTSDIQFKNGIESKAAQVTGWDNGMDTKAWVIEITTLGYENLTISSLQQSGGNEPGPKDYKLQYSVEADVWVDIPDGVITVENDWTTSAVENLPLPEACYDVELLKIRWVMSSNEASAGTGTVLESGKDKIDNIVIMGDMENAIDEQSMIVLNVYPNPTSGLVTINAERNIETIQLISLSGQMVKTLSFNSPFVNFNLSDLPRGTYFLQTKVSGSDILKRNMLVLY